MGAEGPDAPQGPGKGVAHLVVALTQQLAVVHRFVAPFGAVPEAGRRGERDAKPEAGEGRPLRIPEGLPVRGDVLEEGSSQRALELNEPGIGSCRWLLRFRQSRRCSERAASQSRLYSQAAHMPDELVPGLRVDAPGKVTLQAREALLEAVTTKISTVTTKISICIIIPNLYPEGTLKTLNPKAVGSWQLAAGTASCLLLSNTKPKLEVRAFKTRKDEDT